MSAGGYCFDFGLSDAGYRRCRLPVGHDGDHQGRDGSGWADDVEPETCGYCGARYADATPAGRPPTVAPKLAANPAVATADGPAGVSEGDGDAEAVSDLLSVRSGEVNPFARAAAKNARSAELAALVEAYRRGVAAGQAAVDSPAARRTLAPHGLTAGQVLAAVHNILDTGHPDAAAPLLWAVRDYMPKSGSGRRRRPGAAGGTR